MLDHARGYDANRLLQVLRADAGPPTPVTRSRPAGGGLDGEADGNLRGHCSGHFLTMPSQAYAGTGEQVFADKIGTMVGDGK